MIVQDFYKVYERFSKCDQLPKERAEEAKQLCIKVTEALCKQQRGNEDNLIAETELGSDARLALRKLCHRLDEIDPDGKYSELAGFAPEPVSAP